MNKKSVLFFNVDIYLDIERFGQELSKYKFVVHNLDKSSDIVCVVNDPRLSIRKSFEEIQSESFKKFVWERIKHIPIRIAVTEIYNKTKEIILKQKIDGEVVYHDVFDIIDFNENPGYVVEKIVNIISTNGIIKKG